MALWENMKGRRQHFAHMGGNQTDVDSGLRFVDPSVDPSILWDISKFLAEAGSQHLTIRAAIEILRRYPATEYAVGFDGVDDWITVQELGIGSSDIIFETEVWISEDNTGLHLLDIVNDQGDSILTLAATEGENLEMTAHYRSNGETEEEIIPDIELETWHDLSIQSDGTLFSVNVDGTQTGVMSDVDIEDGPFKLYFGKSSAEKYFKGMVKAIKFQSGNIDIFNLRAGEELETEDNTDLASVIGIHELKKGRFQREFCHFSK